MAWVRFTDEAGLSWEVNQLGMWLLVRQYLHAQLVYDHSSTETEHHRFHPDIVTVDVDFAAVRRDKDEEAPRMYDEMAHVSMRSGEDALQRMIDMRRNTEFYVTAFNERSQAASRRTMSNIESAVEFAESAIWVAEAVRNLSATVLVAGASLLSGGAALAVLGAGSSLKGVSTYQDSGNLGSAVLDATGTFVVGAIPLGVAAARAAQAATTSIGLAAQASGQSTRTLAANAAHEAREDFAVVVVGSAINVGVDVSRGAIEGRSMEESVCRAGATLAVDLISGGLIGPALSRSALPVETRLSVGAAVSTAGSATVNAAGAMAEVSNASQELQEIMDVAPVANDDQQFVRDNVFRRA